MQLPIAKSQSRYSNRTVTVGKNGGKKANWSSNQGPPGLAIVDIVRPNQSRPHVFLETEILFQSSLFPI